MTEKTAPPAAEAPAAPPPPAEPPSQFVAVAVDLAQVAGEVAEAAPTPERQADAPAASDGGPAVEPRYASLRDRNGNAFDPKLHRTDAEGRPILTPRGMLWGRPGVVLPAQGGPKPEAAGPARSLDLAAAGLDPDDDEDEDDDDEPAAAPAAAAPVSPPAELTQEERDRLARETAEVTVQILQALGKFIAGKDGAFKRDEENGDEYRDLKASFVSWYATMENLVHVSPGWIVAVNTGRYLSRCASTETGERRIRKGTAWLGSTWSKVRLMWHTWRATKSARP